MDYNYTLRCGLGRPPKRKKGSVATTFCWHTYISYLSYMVRPHPHEQPFLLSSNNDCKNTVFSIVFSSLDHKTDKTDSVLICLLADIVQNMKNEN